MEISARFSRADARMAQGAPIVNAPTASYLANKDNTLEQNVTEAARLVRCAFYQAINLDPFDSALHSRIATATLTMNDIEEILIRSNQRARLSAL